MAVVAPAGLDTLPQHIIRDIITYIIEVPDDFEDLISEYVSFGLLPPLLHLCRLWRSVALPVIFSHCNINLGPEESSFMYRPSANNNCVATSLNALYNNYVRSVTITLDYRALANGAVERVLGQDECVDLCFANARSLDIRITVPEGRNVADDGDSSRNDPDSNSSNDGMAVVARSISNFIAFMRRALPAVRNPSLQISHQATAGDEDGQQALGTSLVSLLGYLDMAYGVDLRLQTRGPMPLYSSCVDAAQISALECQWDEAGHPDLARLIHANARSLRELSIKYHTMAGFDKLLVDDRGCPVSYLYLERVIMFRQGEMAAPEPLPDLQTAAPFPRLRQLQISFAYPFDDDLPFRGNSSTLKTLGIVFDQRTTRLLCRSPAFAKGRLRALEHLVISGNGLNDDTGGRATATAKALFKDLFDRVLNEVHYLYIQHEYAVSRFLPYTQGAARFGNIQLLSLIQTYSTFSELTQIISAFPNMKALICRYSNMGDEFRNMSLQTLVTCMRKRFNPLSSHLQTITIFDFDTRVTSLVAASILLLADRCPNLMRIRFPKFREEKALSVLLRLNQSRYPAKLREAFQSKIDFSLTQAAKHPLIRIKRMPPPVIPL
ncbi:hypothetical protein GGF46_002334 [Coemansia sp. RSA 552]|nr:hypothetical protein GGF46_002334 [Coemansia sp. RSA 552]